MKFLYLIPFVLLLSGCVTGEGNRITVNRMTVYVLTESSQPLEFLTQRANSETGRDRTQTTPVDIKATIPLTP